MPYIGNVTTSSNVNGSQINNGTITGDKLSLPFDYDSATLYLDNTNNRVGILTASPSSTLTVGTGGVVSIPLASAATPSLVFGTDTNTGIYSPGADQVAISTGGSGKLFINSTGVIECYSTAASGTGLTTALKINSAKAVGGDGSEITWNLDFPSYSSLAGIGGVFAGGGNNGYLVFKTVGSGTYAERMRLDSSGRLGVGTSSPGQLLEIRAAASGGAPATSGTTQNGLLRISQTSVGQSLDIGTNADSYSWLQATNRTDLSLKYPLAINPNGGNVGIGTASPRSLLSFGTADTSGTNGINLYDNGGNYRTGIGATSSYLRLYTPSDGSLQLGRLSTSDGSTFLEAARIDNSGRLLVGTSTARTDFYSGTSAVLFQVEGTTFAGSSASLTRNSNDNADGAFVFAKSRATADSGVTVVQADDKLGEISWQGADGVDMVRAARIQCLVDGTPGANDMPGRLVFSTTADGAASPTERLRITSAGRVGIGTSIPTVKLTAIAGAINSDVAVFSGLSTSRGLKVGTFTNTNSDCGVSIDAQDPTYGALFFKTKGTGALFIDPSQRVGIGTTSPSQLLHCERTTAGVTALFGVNDGTFNPRLVVYGGSTGTTIQNTWSSSASNLIFANGGAVGSGTEAMRIDSSGRLGIGTSAPLERLHIGGTGNKALITPVTFGVNQDSAYLIAGSPSYTGATTNWGTFGFQHRIKSNAGGSGRVTIDTKAGEAFCVTDNSLVGIGTTSPHGTLQVHDGTFVLSKPGGGSDKNWRFLPSDAAAGDLAIQQSTTSGGTTYATKLTIDPSGRVGIGVTAPEQLLHIGGNNGIRFGNAAATPKADISYTSVGDEFLDIKIQGTTTGYGNIRFSTGGTPSERARIDSSGRLLVGTSSTSDTKAKLGVAGSVNIGSGSGNSVTLANGATGTVATPVRGYSYININHSNTSSDGLLLLVFANTTTLTIISTVHSNAGTRYTASVSGRNLQVTNAIGVSVTFYASCMTLAWGDNG
jgi:hypothetical protein